MQLAASAPARGALRQRAAAPARPAAVPAPTRVVLNARAPSVVARVASMEMPMVEERTFARKADGSFDLSAPPPFGLADLRNAIPEKCWRKNTLRSMAHLALDVAIVVGLAAGAMAINAWWSWPLYWAAQGTMFWALFVVGHDCGHQSFSNSRALNDFIGHLTHSSILVPYHGWRVSHRKHHGNHGHVENDESWHPTTKSQVEGMDKWGKLGRLKFPAPLFAYPFYLFNRSPGKEGSHFDPDCDLFVPSERRMVLTTNAFLAGFAAILAVCTAKLGVVAMLGLYFVPYWVFVAWLDVVTYLHHHGPSDAREEMPWYRGDEWSYLRGGLTTIDRDYGLFNKVHHDIGTHVVHHLFPQIPHYHLEEATEAAKKVMGPYYREPEPSPGLLPTHLIAPLVRSFGKDHYVDDATPGVKGEVLYYKKLEGL